MTFSLAAADVATFYPLNLWILTEEGQVRGSLLGGLRVSHNCVLWVRLGVEHQPEGFVVGEVAACVIYIWIHLEIPAAQFSEVPGLRRLQAQLVLERM